MYSNLEKSEFHSPDMCFEELTGFPSLGIFFKKYESCLEISNILNQNF